jgi:RNA polymerase sigma factor (sigma-70 family)
MAKAPAASFPEDLRELRAALLRTAHVLTRNHADAEDLVQTALLRAFDRGRDLPSDINWPAWLKTVIRHLAVDRARRHRRWRMTELGDSADLQFHVQGVAESAVPAVSPEELQGAVDSVEAHYQLIYRLFHVEGASYAQLAARLNIPIRTVGTRLHRARGRIRANLLAQLETNAELARVRAQAARPTAIPA